MTLQAGRLYLVDTSALARVALPRVRDALVSLVADRLAATCVTVDLEMGYSGRDHPEVAEVAAYRRESYTVLPISELDAQRAREVQVRMAERGHHRAAGVIDLLTAAVAERHDATVLHYDADFEHIAAVTGQAQLWIAPRGSLD